ncbi:hypothetical protein [Streptomyces sp. NPDC048172]|uniref:hypothetical protein n=1 Tax=Streptomyces sp. NPDC048172 TaxID=3365505 RepID=UPI003714A835
MTQPPTAPPAPPSSPASSAAASPAPVPPPVPAGTPAPAAPPGRTAWAEGVYRIRAAVVTEPGRLRTIGAALAALVVLFGGVTAWQIADRKSSADAVVEHSQPLSADAARVYRSLADADTTASSGFLAGGDEREQVRERYERDIRQASELLVNAAANSKSSASAQKQIAILNRGLPRYTGLVESARANNRQGLPLGGAYLRYANEKMRGELLPAASKLYTAETARLGGDYDDAKSWPYLAIGAGVLALGGLVWAQRRNYRRTNRVFNTGLVGATAATLAVLVWLTGGHAMARAGLAESDEKGARSLQQLNDAWIGTLQARGDENMTLVARGGGATYEESYKKQMTDVAGNGRGADRGGGGQLDEALALADDSAGREAVEDAKSAVGEWKKRHAKARDLDDNGGYEASVDKVIGAKDSTGQSFDEVDRSLEAASVHEQKQFEEAADGGRGWFGGLTIGALVLALAGAATAVWGIGRRLSEYR